MECAELRALIPDRLKGETLPGPAHQHLQSCPACRAELADLEALWAGLGALAAPTPTAALRARVLRRRSRFLPGLLTAAAVLALVASGVAADRLFSGNSGTAAAGNSPETAQARASLVLIRNPAAPERIKGLALMGPGDPHISELLLEIVQHDPDTQVRLAAVDSLFLAAGDPQLRIRLGAALQQQDRPEVQIALVDLIVGMRERQALEALRRLEQSGRLQPEVRHRLDAGISCLETVPL